jgi:hypothetical protein
VRAVVGGLVVGVVAIVAFGVIVGAWLVNHQPVCPNPYD